MSQNIGTWSLRVITPVQASEMFATRATNRNPTASRIDSYATSMAAGKWVLTHQGIAIHNGQVIDGQTRLSACVQSGVPLTTWVYETRDTENYVHEVDRHNPRRDCHVAQIAGRDVTSNEIAWMRVMEGGRRSFKANKQIIADAADVLALCDKHKDVIAWLYSTGFSKRTRGMGQAAIVGAIGRASFIYGRTRMEDFVRVYTSGVVNGPGDSAASRLREYALVAGGKQWSTREECYLKSCAAIRAFVERRPLSKLYATEGPDEPLPMPCDADNKSAP